MKIKTEHKAFGGSHEHLARTGMLKPPVATGRRGSIVSGGAVLREAFAAYNMGAVGQPGARILITIAAQ